MPVSCLSAFLRALQPLAATSLLSVFGFASSGHFVYMYMVLGLVSALALYPMYIHVVVCGCPILLRLGNVLLVVKTWLLVCLSVTGRPFFGCCECTKCRISVGLLQGACLCFPFLSSIFLLPVFGTLSSLFWHLCPCVS